MQVNADELLDFVLGYWTANRNFFGAWFSGSLRGIGHGHLGVVIIFFIDRLNRREVEHGRVYKFRDDLGNVVFFFCKRPLLDHSATETGRAMAKHHHQFSAVRAGENNDNVFGNT